MCFLQLPPQIDFKTLANLLTSFFSDKRYDRNKKNNDCICAKVKHKMVDFEIFTLILLNSKYLD